MFNNYINPEEICHSNTNSFKYVKSQIIFFPSNFSFFEYWVVINKMRVFQLHASFITVC